MKSPLSTSAGLVSLAFCCVSEPAVAQRGPSDAERLSTQSQPARETTDSPEARPFGLVRPKQSAPLAQQDPAKRGTEGVEAANRSTTPVSGYRHPLVPEPRGFVGGNAWATLERVQIERLTPTRAQPARPVTRKLPTIASVNLLRPLVPERVLTEKLILERPNLERPVFDRVENRGAGRANLERLLKTPLPGADPLAQSDPQASPEPRMPRELRGQTSEASTNNR